MILYSRIMIFKNKFYIKIKIPKVVFHSKLIRFKEEKDKPQK